MTKPKYQIIAGILQDKILRKLYPPGSKLPGHLVLAQEFGVSPITSNRALFELEQLGLIQRRQRSGSFVLESPKTLNQVLIIVGGSLDTENLQLMDYWRGIVAHSEKDGVSLRTVTTSDPKLSELLRPELTLGRGIILIGSIPDTVAKGVEQLHMPYIYLGQESGFSRFCVLEDRRRAACGLVRTMMEDGCQRVGFVGNWTASNHRLARDGYLEAVSKLDLGYRYLRDADQGNITEVLHDLLAEDLAIDAMLIMGGHLPVAALPIVLNCPRPIKLGVMAENSTVLQLRNVAYVAYYSQFDTGRMAYELLKYISAGSVTSATTCYPPFTILRPGQEPPPQSEQSSLLIAAECLDT